MPFNYLSRVLLPFRKTPVKSIAQTIILLALLIIITAYVVQREQAGAVEEPLEVGVTTYDGVTEDDPLLLLPTPTPSVLQLVGEASYYSEDGCLGGSPVLTMANSERLDDTKLTLALTPEIVRKHKLLNDVVTVENVKTGLSVQARVTDTGDFSKYNRVADLSLATKLAIECNGLCQVIITYENTN